LLFGKLFFNILITELCFIKIILKDNKIKEELEKKISKLKEDSEVNKKQREEMEDKVDEVCLYCYLLRRTNYLRLLT